MSDRANRQASPGVDPENSESLPDLERRRAEAIKDVVETEEAHDMAVEAAKRAGKDPERQPEVQLLAQNLKKSMDAWHKAAGRHQAALYAARHESAIRADRRQGRSD